MLKTFKHYCFICFCFCFSLLFAQQNFSKSNFKNASLERKIEAYNRLSDSLKINHKTFIKSVLSLNDTTAIDQKLKFKLKITLAELDYLGLDYFESINKYKALYNNPNLSTDEKIDILDRLKKPYYKLHLYPEIFEINSTIKKLISKGANYPLWSYNMDSKLYRNLFLYDKAAVALKKEIEQLKKSNINDALILPSAYNDLGHYFYKSKVYDSAFIYYNKSLTYANKNLKKSDLNNFNTITAVVKSNLAYLLVAQKKYKAAKPLLLESIKLAKSTKNNTLNSIDSYNLLSECYIFLADYKSAKNTLNVTKTLLRTLKNDQKRQIAYLRNKATYFDQTRRKDSSNFYFKKALFTKDSIDTKDISQILASNELMYHRAEKRKLKEQHLLDLKNKEIALKQNQRNVTIILATLLFTLLLYSLYNGYNLKKSRREIKQKKHQIKIALEEKEVLLKEIHHRVKNNLQIISGLLELQQLDEMSDEVKLILKEGQNRIQSVALIHKMMYQSDNVSKVNMNNYLNELLIVLNQSYKSQKKAIKVIISVKNIHLEINKAVPLSLIVNEAVCNAYKHAFVNKNEGQITINLQELDQKHYQLIVKDNGIGLPKNFDEIKNNSIGFDLIYGLTRQLKGTTELQTINGTELKITFSL